MTTDQTPPETSGMTPPAESNERAKTSARETGERDTELPAKPETGDDR
ncbi:hypothetical protein [Haladaptatus cibarius]|nr:hypothetical protein [Haladaptatus cibarius]